ncbi:MAG: DUF3369 domain-containing protein [Pseudomonadota bacterium]
MNSNQLFIVHDDTPAPHKTTKISNDTWKIAIIDDNKEVHIVTKMVLKNFSFDNKSIHFLYAFSAAEGLELFKQHDDIAVCLVDVVMETEHAGLQLVKNIRDDLKNTLTRIVLRTGQPGQAPEDEVIKNYDINDYKEKTELTHSKLNTLLYSCLRSYRDLVSLDQARKGLEQVINATTQVSGLKLIEDFSQGILQQISSVLNIDKGDFLLNCSGLAAHGEDSETQENIKVVAGTGKFKHKVGNDISQLIPIEKIDLVKQHDEYFYSTHDNDSYLACYHGENMPKNILYFKGLKPRDNFQQKLLEIYSRNVLVAFENICLKSESEDAQREIVYMLGDAVESRSIETGHHLKRVALLSSILAKKLKLSALQVDLIVQASPLHDLGKIGIPDHILHKPGKFDASEWEIMKSHVTLGYDKMKKSHKKVFKMGAIIALEHHERWDGEGYPDKKKATEVSIEGRIVAVADVFDALASKRCYKNPWEIDDVFQYMEKNAGSQFDPQLIKLLLLEKQQIRKLYHNFEQ